MTSAYCILQISSQSKTSDFNVPTNTNGHTLSHKTSRPDLQKRIDAPIRSADPGYLAPARINALNRKDSSISETGSAPDSLLDLYGPNRSGISSFDYGERKRSNGDVYGDDEDPEHSRWIHRDKLARIESQELQAAGRILRRSRAPSKSSRTRDPSKEGTALKNEPWQRLESFPTEEEETPESNTWDLRLPGEAAEDPGDIYRDIAGVKGVSRIPVCKTSPLPIPIEHLERDTPIRRKQSGAWPGEDDSISYPKTRSRSQSIKASDDSAATPAPAKRPGNEASPTKKASARKGSVQGVRSTSAPQRPKTKSGPVPGPGLNRDTASAQRPPTRSGEIGQSNSTKRPEGDPPWISSMYKPDPRLPPEQQLLPTVAKRLQQEQWEREGKFGNTYDTSFRPLNDEEFPTPEPVVQNTEIETKQADGHDSEWPLRNPKSPTLSSGRPGTAGGTGGYSTMPKITGMPQVTVPLPSPKPPLRVQELLEEKQKGGCGCCVVM